LGANFFAGTVVRRNWWHCSASGVGVGMGEAMNALKGPTYLFEVCILNLADSKSDSCLSLKVGVRRARPFAGVMFYDH
jgi:hypothetical protein